MARQPGGEPKAGKSFDSVTGFRPRDSFFSNIDLMRFELWKLGREISEWIALNERVEKLLGEPEEARSYLP